MVLPAAVRYLDDLLAAAERATTIGIQTNGLHRAIMEVNTLIDELSTVLQTLVEENAELGGDDVRSKAHHMRDRILPAMAAVREVVDRMEKVIPDDLWPLPRYREMLFVK
jgi:glutamine synthetase